MKNIMTVSELIKALEKFDENTKIYVSRSYVEHEGGNEKVDLYINGEWVRNIGA